MQRKSDENGIEMEKTGGKSYGRRTRSLEKVVERTMLRCRESLARVDPDGEDRRERYGRRTRHLEKG